MACLLPLTAHAQARVSPDNYEILNAETITTQPVLAANTNATKPAFAAAQRRKVEALFAELKN